MRRLAGLLSLSLSLSLACACAALANERAESEARLAALADQIIPALAAAMPQVPGMDCTAGAPDPSPTNRLLLPNWRADCRFAVGDKERSSTVTLIVSETVSQLFRDEIAKAAKDTGNSLRQVFGQPDPRALLQSHKLSAAPGQRVAALAIVPREGDEELAPAEMADLAQALAAMDVAAFESLPAVQDHAAALADHRRLLEAQHVALAGMLPPAVNGRDPAALGPPDAYPDHAFFALEPFVLTSAMVDGVSMMVTLTTSSFAMEFTAEEGQFAAERKNGDTSPRGVYHDRGRVRVYLGDKGLTALIDNRALLTIDVASVADGADPIAAMEAVLARIAANDFRNY